MRTVTCLTLVKRVRKVRIPVWRNAYETLPIVQPCPVPQRVGLSPSSVGQPSDDDILEMKVKGVTMDPQRDTPVVILEEPQGRLALPIWIGFPEARAIALEMEGVPTPRPLTHVLLHNILTDLNVKNCTYHITDIQDTTFYAILLLRQENKTLTIDARPSDAIALALHVNAPVFVTKKLLNVVRPVTLQEPAAPSFSTKTLGMLYEPVIATLAHFFHLAKAEGVLISLLKQTVKRRGTAYAAAM